jgi:hypothetical protein
MPKLEDIVRYENANSCVAFRERAYRREESAALLQDLIALANAAAEGPRFLFLGVNDIIGGKRDIAGIARTDWTVCRHVLGAAVGVIEPRLKVAARSVVVDGKLVGLLYFAECGDPPYLLGERVPRGLQAGCGWIRRGTKTLPLLRADLLRLIEGKARPEPAFDIIIGFPGDPPQTEITYPVLPLDELPSAVAARKLHQLLEAKRSTKVILGKTQTRLSRLVHAQLFGVDKPYEHHSDDSLRVLIARTADDHRAADEHYEFELRAHKLQLLVQNRGPGSLEGAVLRVELPRLDGIGVAERRYASDGAVGDGRYPLVTTRDRIIAIETAIGVVPDGATVAAFRDEPRLWARPQAAAKSVAVHCTLHARELREPLRETLVARFVDGQARA